jgi:hypothetical protein
MVTGVSSYIIIKYILIDPVDYPLSDRIVRLGFTGIVGWAILLLYHYAVKLLPKGKERPLYFLMMIIGGITGGLTGVTILIAILHLLGALS